MHIENTDRVLTVFLSGEIDHHTAAPMREKIDADIIKSTPSELILDFSGVTFMDSSGIGLIMGRHRLMLSLEGDLRLQGASPRMERMIRLAGLDKLPIWEEETK